MPDCMRLQPGVLQGTAREFKEQPVSREDLDHTTFKSVPFYPCSNEPSMSKPGSEHGAEDTGVGKGTQEANYGDTACCTLHRFLFPTSQGGGPDLSSSTPSAKPVPTLWVPQAPQNKDLVLRQGWRFLSCSRLCKNGRWVIIRAHSGSMPLSKESETHANGRMECSKRAALNLRSPAPSPALTDTQIRGLIF